MPIYEFKCRKCGAHLEVFQKVSDKPPVRCRKCGGRLEKLLSAPAIQFKGSGWYVTDYAGSHKKAAAKDEAEATVSEDKKSEKSEKKSKESSPAKKTSEKASTPKVPTGD
jgi:putative FmdB family regulatory protein